MSYRFDTVKAKQGCLCYRCNLPMISCAESLYYRQGLYHSKCLLEVLEKEHYISASYEDYYDYDDLEYSSRCHYYLAGQYLCSSEDEPEYVTDRLTEYFKSVKRIKFY